SAPLATSSSGLLAPTYGRRHRLADGSQSSALMRRAVALPIKPPTTAPATASTIPPAEKSAAATTPSPPPASNPVATQVRSRLSARSSYSFGAGISRLVLETWGSSPCEQAQASARAAPAGAGFGLVPAARGQLEVAGVGGAGIVLAPGLGVGARDQDVRLGGVRIEGERALRPLRRIGAVTADVLRMRDGEGETRVGRILVERARACLGRQAPGRAADQRGIAPAVA